ncbi:linear amide C-N hydrolase [Acetobacter vaccinii]|uniref:Linear amide C-N hydrolase n=1 Tax=Acetobacter vaccinii TaxID=2592655 RepID=A0A5C1YLN7_9PROT|nr:linear amide C-N hydrolase [Acetobacter vaccinii]QEO17224.1 linear amide C-N hydrolase [Acetobacter vaccinii]
MENRHLNRLKARASRLLAGACAVGVLAWAGPASACTRVVYLGGEAVMTARSMDWKQPIGTSLYILPRGMDRCGEAGPNSLRWTSKYGSVVATGYDVSTTDGANEAGLVANLLWLAESHYPEVKQGSKPGLTIAAWAQYVLDNYATVAEAVAALEHEPFTVVTSRVPGQDRLATLHLSISDPTGDSAIIEYIDGKQTIHHGRQYQVMTNSPAYDEQLARASYWKEVGGMSMLPGTSRASDRFVRASFYINAVPQDVAPDRALASVFGVIRNVSVPLGISSPTEPELSSTRWRTVFDHKRKLYFFESAMSPSIFWVDLKKVDFSPQTGGVRRLDLGVDESNIYSGDATSQFQKAQPFKFLGL